MSNRNTICTSLLLIIGAVTVALGQYAISWQSVDSGGAMSSAGGTFSLDGTIGQPDAGSFAQPMTGGTFQLVGGFWAFAPGSCACLGDMNCDGAKDGRDIAAFVQAILDPVGYGATYPLCSVLNGDFDGNNQTTAADVPGMVGCMVSGSCS